jgi:lipoyl(octanoyl) transferase
VNGNVRPEPGPTRIEPVRTASVEWLGTVTYRRAVEIQRELVAARREGRTKDQLLLLEHPHVITLGSSADAGHILIGDAERALLGIEVHDSGRGGDVTYHGPGQLVGYPILDLKPDRRDLHRYVRDLEEMLIRCVGDFGLEATRWPGRTGVWVGDRKIAAIGVRVSSGWITSHGFALNVSTDLRFFESIVPCGIHDAGVTSLVQCGVAGDTLEADVREAVTRHFGEVFGLTVEHHPRTHPERLVDAAGVVP